MKKLTLENFIDRAKSKHGNHYDYSKVIYIGDKSKIKIICSIHGEFFQTPRSHLNGRGCPNCGGSKKLDVEKFIENSNLIHKNIFNYSKVIYVNNRTKVNIICPIHGSFLQTPDNHLKGAGCKKCSIIKRINILKKTPETFISEANELHNGKYDYTESKYINYNTKLKIICPKHGLFWQTPHAHLAGHNCPNCRNVSFDEFIQRAKKIHGNKYDYSKVKYIDVSTKVEIICKDHDSFFQIPYSHMLGSGCSKCANKISKPEIEFLDFIKCPLKNYRLPEWKAKSVDGYDFKTNIVYEFLGDYYHGNPEKYDSKKYNQKCHKTYGELYDKTIKNLNKLKSFGYDVKYIWERDWKDFKSGYTISPNIQTFNGL